MIVGFVDVVRSADAAEQGGFPATLRLREQLRELAEILGMVGPADSPRFIGERQGDGFAFAAPREHALTYLKEVVKVQMTTWMHAAWAPARISLGVAVASWDGEPWRPGSTFNGRDVTVVARLVDRCAPGGVVINRELQQLLWEHAPELRKLFVEQTAELQGFERPETFWVLRSLGRRRTRMGDKSLMAVVGGVLLLLAATAAGAWRTALLVEGDATAAQAHARDSLRVEESVGALIWTLCETVPSCKDRNLEEPAYIRHLREKQRSRSQGAGPR